MEGAGREERPRLIRNHDAIDDWFPEDAPGWLGHLLEAYRNRREHLAGCLRPQTGEGLSRVLVRAAERRGKGVPMRGRFGHRGQRRGIGALDDRPMEEPGAVRRDQVQADTLAAADVPASVTLPGSPPNRAMLSRTQRSAAR